MLNQNHRPLYEHLQLHSKKNAARYHMPGHHGGELFDLPFWKQIAQWDVTETYGMDDLYSPYSIIREAEQLAAEAFGASKTFFLVNGTSSGLLASIHGLFRHGDTLLVQRNAHKSIYNGMLLLGIDPAYLMPETIEPETIAGVVTPDILRTAVIEHPGAKGVIITSPTYYGKVADIKKLAEICKENDMILLVDEAHGAYYSFHSELKNSSAIHQGADIVVQSIHKTLPALTMGSMLHVSHKANTKIDMDRLSYYLSVFQTTSPSYLVMASLDYARHWAFHHGQEAITKAFQRKRKLCDELEAIGIRPWDTIWEQAGNTTDPLKLTLPIDSLGMNSKELELKLASVQIYIELVSVDHILLLLGLGMDEQTDERLLKALARHTRQQVDIGQVGTKQQLKTKKQVKTKKLRLPQNKPKIAIPFSTIAQEIKQKLTRSLAIEHCAGEVAAEFVIPYPPGIPLLCPGEIITNEHVECIIEAKAAGLHLQGGFDKESNSVRCYVRETLV